MQMRLVFILTFGLIINSWGQTSDTDCKCPPNKFSDPEPRAIFTLTNGKSIVLCGYVESKDNEKLFSEFVLAECGQDNIIDFWDALTVCRIKTNKDTLIIEELKNLPTGENFAFIPTVWTIEKLYFSVHIERESQVNRKIKKYNKQEIKTVLNEYDNTSGKLNDDKMILANKLFMASISGDKTARKYLSEFKTKFGTLDGAFAEDYKELIAMLKNWD